MKHLAKKNWSLFVPARIRALNYERELRLDKIKECSFLKEENAKLFDLVVKQRMALETMKEGHAKDMAEMTESLRKAHAKLSAVEAERDRYRDALRRAFPKKEASA